MVPDTEWGFCVRLQPIAAAMSVATQRYWRALILTQSERNNAPLARQASEMSAEFNAESLGETDRILRLAVPALRVEHAVTCRHRNSCEADGRPCDFYP